MASIRIVQGPSGPYKVLVQTYRWNGEVKQKQIYLGTKIPTQLDPLVEELNQRIWKETWFPLFDQIRDAHKLRASKIPLEVDDAEREEFLVRFTFDTNRIEGSSLSLEETRDIIESSRSPASKPLSDVLEAKRHADLVRSLLARPEPVDLPHVLAWHRALFGETKPRIAGTIRDFQVKIGGSSHTPPSPLEVRPMLKELLRWTSRSRGKVHPVELAGRFHQRFESIHPFGDGNGRIGRLAMNLLLGPADFPMTNIRYAWRHSYYKALEDSDTAQSSRPFLRWFYLRYSREHAYLIEKPRAGRKAAEG